MDRLPDFIIIGAMKSATSTLHEQLAVQPGIFMSRPKEPNFFSNDEIVARGPDWYRALFAAADWRDLCGESSMHYTKLPTYPRTIERMIRALPRVKLIYIMRDPIDRLVSQYLHYSIRGEIDVPIDEALARHPELTDYSRYSMQLEPFLGAFGPESVLPVFFERLVKHPQAELERICRFIGYEGQPRWDCVMRAQNVTSEQMRKSVLREMIISLPVLSGLRRRLVPRRWSECLKALWRVSPERPRLRSESVDRLRAVFDGDLARLGDWLGIALDCEHFSEIVLAGPYEWAGL
ncbi:MAG TPA: sulfotransferase, partial [Isosphaeraceae bacterium]|nr:sulfotransferase [Isosphaeraceae bacterium]